jgi:hypothetical protein
VEDARGRVWSPYEVQAWAKRWRGEKPLALAEELEPLLADRHDRVQHGRILRQRLGDEMAADADDGDAGHAFRTYLASR